MLRFGCRERKGESGGGGREGGTETVVQSQNTTNAKVAGMEEVGGKEKMRGKNLLLNLITSMDGWTVMGKALFMANHLDCPCI